MAKSATNFTPAQRPEARPSARDPLAYLRSDDALGALLPAVQQVAQLQAACEALLPMLFGSCIVLHLRQGTLTIAAPNAALATRLRQVQPDRLGRRVADGTLPQVRPRVAHRLISR